MGISLKTHKILWARSGNMCAICSNELIVDSLDQNDDPSIVGDEAHIIARKDTFTRYKDKNVSKEEREAELKRVEDELFGNETDVGDHLAYGSGVVVPETLH